MDIEHKSAYDVISPLDLMKTLGSSQIVETESSIVLVFP